MRTEISGEIIQFEGEQFRSLKQINLSLEVNEIKVSSLQKQEKKI